MFGMRKRRNMKAPVLTEVECQNYATKDEYYRFLRMVEDRVFGGGGLEAQFTPLVVAQYMDHAFIDRGEEMVYLTMTGYQYLTDHEQMCGPKQGGRSCRR